MNGFPREASAAVEIGSVRTNFRMPDVISLGLGGGSLVRGDADGPTIGPDSVGFELQTRALVFGGSEMTATDIAVASGRAEIGDGAKVGHLSRPFVDAALDRMQYVLATTIEQMKTSADPVPVVIVGGGGVLVGNDLEGASVTMRPEHYEVANAIGAAIAQVGAETDQVYSLADMGRLAALDQARQITVDRAIEAGADPTTVEVVDVEEVPLAYLPSNAVRIRVKAVGDLRPESAPQASSAPESLVQGVQP